MAPFRSLTKLSTEHLNGTCSDWLKASPKGEFHARCSYCQQCFVIGYMGRSAFKNHEKSRKHRGKVAAAKNTPSVFGFQSVRRSNVAQTVSTEPVTEASSTVNVPSSLVISVPDTQNEVPVGPSRPSSKGINHIL